MTQLTFERVGELAEADQQILIAASYQLFSNVSLNQVVVMEIHLNIFCPKRMSATADYWLQLVVRGRWKDL